MEDFIAHYNYIATSDSDEITAIPLSDVDRQVIKDNHLMWGKFLIETKLNETTSFINPLLWDSMTDEEKNAWRDYRQALLNVQHQPGFPYQIEWPKKP